MKKTSVYLSDEHVTQLRRIANAEGRSQADVIRDAIAAYDGRGGPDREFALARSFASGSGSIADLPEEELLQGFGE